MPAAAPPAAIAVRVFKPEDAPEVHRIFAAGMSSLLSTFLWRVLYDASFMAVLVAATGLAAWVASGDGVFAAVKGGFLAGSFVVLAVAGYVAHSLHSYIQQSLGDDLRDISAFYVNNPAAPGSCFWVAEATSLADDKTQQETGKPLHTIVGCVALEHKSEQQAELRRMSVDANWQRRGIAAQLCRALLAHAKAAGYDEVFLTTSQAQPAARALYECTGWQETESGKVFWNVSFHKYVYGLKAAVVNKKHS